ncbi:MAG: Fic family protein [Kiloniellales bacterium]|nr:Fic family protein [Kiloniellales bacterium]
MPTDRHSIAQPQELITDPDEKARREAENGVHQFRLATDIIREHIQDPERPFRLAPRHILQLHHAALEGIHALAGTYRNTPVQIGKSNHQPPEHYYVAEHVDALCRYVNDNWEVSSAIHLAAYVLWRLNWIHPFADGNGRTARAAMYVVLNTRLNGLLAGTPTIPDQIADDKVPYYDALEAADEPWKDEVVDVSAMEELLEGMLATQLYNAVQQASEEGTTA